jgi:hypothetical protein
MDDRRFKAMNLSILLASTLLEIGLPYLASWLPEPVFAKGYNPRVNGGRPWAGNLGHPDAKAILTAPAPFVMANMQGWPFARNTTQGGLVGHGKSGKITSYSMTTMTTTMKTL